MKKFLLTLIAGAMILSMVSCTSETAPEGDDTIGGEVESDATDGETTPEGEDAESESDEDGNTVESEENAEGDEETSDKTIETVTLGASLNEIFKANAESAESAEALAAKIIEEAALPLNLAAMPYEINPDEPFLSGFDNKEFTEDIEEVAMFAPMIGTIPFIGYIFELPEGADVSAFKESLNESANLRWNICTTADEMIVDSVGNTVFFVMCPISLDDGGADADAGMAL